MRTPWPNGPTTTGRWRCWPNYYQRGRTAGGRAPVARETRSRVEPAIPELLGNLGTVWERLGEPGKAVTYARAALALRPHDAKTMTIWAMR